MRNSISELWDTTQKEARCRNPCYLLGIMLNDLMTAFLVAFAAVTASDLLSRIWEYF
jgi:hypothetical protein